MDISFYTAAVGVEHQQYRMNVHGNNIANVNNYGFRPRRTAFSTLMANQVRGTDEDYMRNVGAKLESTEGDFWNTRAGFLMATTNRPLDYAIEGNGFFALEDPVTGEVTQEEYEEEVEVEYDYYICSVSLENFKLSHLPIYTMSEYQVSLYAMYMSTLGNRPDLFPTSDYISKYIADVERYEIPPEALSDEKFAAMIAEAEKFLGYPYVWGGSSPSTSFDCSGFVSWVINHCGVGWNVGRLGSDALYFDVCTPVSPANARPGDLIFFQHTYDTPYTSHVGIYVGNGMMIHCGDPIRYVSIETSYWQSHFYGFGRLPEI